MFPGGDTMTGTIDDGPSRVVPQQTFDSDIAEGHRDSDTSGTSTPVVSHDTVSAQERLLIRQLLSDLRSDVPWYVQWILWLPLGAPLRAIYKDHVVVYNRDLEAYFETNKFISDDNRRLSRESFLSLIRRVNVYQAWLFVAYRFRNAAIFTAEIPSWLTFAIITCVVAWTPTPLPIKMAYIFLSLLFTLTVFVVYLRDQYLVQYLVVYRRRRLYLPVLDNPWSKTAWLLAFVVVMASAWLLFGAWSKLGVLAACSILLLAATGTLIALGASMYVKKNIRSLRIRAAVYLIGIGGLSFAVAGIKRPHRPLWLAFGTWSALWASLVLILALAAVLLFNYLVTSLVWNWKNRRYTVAELVQTLAWLGMSLEDEERPEEARSPFSTMSPTLAEVGKVEALEYIANLMEQWLPKHLRTYNPAGDRIIAERCRGMACAVRQVKLQFVLNGTSPSELASQLSPAIPYVALRKWGKIEHVDQQDRPTAPRWTRALRMLGAFVAAVAPLAVLLTLRATAPSVPNKILDQALPITVTWLLVSIITWIDPGNGERPSTVKDVLDLLRPK
jgi:hypothetical protein